MQLVFRVLLASALACAALAVQAGQPTADAAPAGSQRSPQASADAGADGMPVSRPLAMLAGLVAAAAFVSIRCRSR